MRMTISVIIAFVLSGISQVMEDLGRPESKREIWAMRPTLGKAILFVAMWFLQPFAKAMRSNENKTRAFAFALLGIIMQMIILMGVVWFCIDVTNYLFEGVILQVATTAVLIVICGLLVLPLIKFIMVPLTLIVGLPLILIFPDKKKNDAPAIPSSASAPKSNSYIVEWTKRRLNELGEVFSETPENIFVCFMYLLATFAEPNHKHKSNEKLLAIGLDAGSRFANDSSLFELGCYIYFRFDEWLFLTHPNLREEIARKFIREFTQLFKQALHVENIHELFIQRIEKYSELARLEEDTKTYYFYLSQLMMRTVDGQKPKWYDFSNEPLTFDSIFLEIGLKMQLASWEVTMFPTMIDIMKKALAKLK